MLAITGPAPKPATVQKSASALPVLGCVLVAIEPLWRVDPVPTPTRRPFTSFLAQLIATRDRAPQTRARSRATPEETIACYHERIDEPAACGRRLRRSA
jgi:hypothetical protein